MKVGYVYMAEPDVPQECVAALRAALFSTYKDEAFVAEATKVTLDFAPIDAELVKARVEEGGFAQDGRGRRTGTIGSSWAAYFLSRGFAVRASDPAPNAEAAVRRFVETAWPALQQLGCTPNASPDHLTFSAKIEDAVDGAMFAQESAPEREEIKIAVFRQIDAALNPISSSHRVRHT